MSHGHGRYPRRRDVGDGYSRRDEYYRSSGRYANDPRDYGDMYDEHPASNRESRLSGYDDDWRQDDYSSSRGRRRNMPRSPSGDRRVSSRSRNSVADAGPPTDTVILEGLPFGFSAAELQDSIFNNSVAADFPGVDVRVSASRGSRRAFIQFEHVDQAIAFMRAHYPKLYIDLEHSTDETPEHQFAAYIHYARSREEGEVRSSNTTANWTCSACEFSNYATRSVCKLCGTSQANVNWRDSLTGAADAADVPSQILVVYPLAPFVDEEMLARDLKKLELQKPEAPKNTGGDAPKLKSTAPTSDASGYGARPGSLHRVFLMRDIASKESFKYGFVEFWTLEDAAAAMTKFKMSRSFTVAGCAATLSTIHMGVFIPESRPVTPATEHISFHPLFNPSILVKYRDPHAYPSQLVVAAEPPAGSDSSRKQDDATNEIKKVKKRKADASLPGALAKKSLPMAGQMAMWQRKHDELMGTPHSSNGDSKAQVGSDGGQGQSKRSEGGFEQKGPIKILLPSSKNFGPSTAAPTTTASDTQKGESGNGEASKPSTDKSPDTADKEVELYMDRGELTCLICRFRYKNLEEVAIHEKSRRHKAAMEDPELVKKALPRLAKRDERLRAEAEEANKAQYRDRAKERRETFNQSKKQAPPNKAKGDGKPIKQDVAPPSSSKPAAPSKGAGMLAKMGWTAGAGLGANSDGRTDVIATNAYQEGVGLGAEGGNLGDAAQHAEKRTKSSYANYVNEVQDKARERYNKMG